MWSDLEAINQGHAWSGDLFLVLWPIRPVNNKTKLVSQFIYASDDKYLLICGASQSKGSFIRKAAAFLSTPEFLPWQFLRGRKKPPAQITKKVRRLLALEPSRSASWTTLESPLYCDTKRKEKKFPPRPTRGHRDRHGYWVFNYPSFDSVVFIVAYDLRREN